MSLSVSAEISGTVNACVSEEESIPRTNNAIVTKLRKNISPILLLLLTYPPSEDELKREQLVLLPLIVGLLKLQITSLP
jgi:hypothetical protein